VNVCKVKAHLAPSVSGLNLVVAAVLRDSLCRVIAARRGRLLYVV